MKLFEKKLKLEIRNRTLNELRDEERYRGWKALKMIMPRMKDING